LILPVAQRFDRLARNTVGLNVIGTMANTKDRGLFEPIKRLIPFYSGTKEVIHMANKQPPFKTEAQEAEWRAKNQNLIEVAVPPPPVSIGYAFCPQTGGSSTQSSSP
jgi:hypothetical protein